MKGMVVNPLFVSEDPQPRKPYVDSVAIASATACTILLGLGCSLGFGLGGLHLMGDSWMQYNEVANSYFTMTPVSHETKLDLRYISMHRLIVTLLYYYRLRLLEYT